LGWIFLLFSGIIIGMKRNILKKKKVLIALSGGIDSAVSAYLLLKQGYEVEAAFMKNWSSTKGLKYDECPWLVDRQDALRVAAFLKIPLHTLDFEKEYEQNVLEYFFREYEAGHTPNPDVMCNKEIKFKLLYNWAMEQGFDYLATGHYAQIGKSKKEKVKRKKTDSTFYLARSADEFKDQTYFIYNIKTEQLPHVLFPIGGMKKTQVKVLAKKIGLPNALKKESMGLCFVGKIRLQDFLNQKLHEKAGPILNQAGKNLGQHHGLHYYTIGQRQGIKVGADGPYYVVKKDLKTNALYVTNDPQDKALEIKEIELYSVNWIDPTFSFPLSPSHLLGRFRHQGSLVPVTVRKISDDHYGITFKKPQKAIASGQSLVLYNKKVCVGGGVIA
jgi:tRNA-specific 2-thiouridylase